MSKSCENCVEAQLSMVDHVQCAHYAGDRHRSTFEDTARICKFYEPRTMCKTPLPSSPWTCCLELGHEGSHRGLLSNDCVVVWGKKEEVN